MMLNIANESFTDSIKTFEKKEKTIKVLFVIVGKHNFTAL